MNLLIFNGKLLIFNGKVLVNTNMQKMKITLEVPRLYSSCILYSPGQIHFFPLYYFKLLEINGKL